MDYHCQREHTTHHIRLLESLHFCLTDVPPPVWDCWQKWLVWVILQGTRDLGVGVRMGTRHREGLLGLASVLGPPSRRGCPRAWGDQAQVSSVPLEEQGVGLICSGQCAGPQPGGSRHGLVSSEYRKDRGGLGCQEGCQHPGPQGQRRGPGYLMQRLLGGGERHGQRNRQ